MSDKSLTHRFLEAVESLNLKFPVAAISAKTKYGQPSVSTYLKGKTEVSMKFLKAFCNAYQLDFQYISTGKRPTSGPAVVAAEKEKPDSMDYRAELTETKEDLRAARKVIDAHVEYLQELLKTSLGKLIEGQSGGLALILEILDLGIRQEAGGNKDKAKEIRAEIARRIGPKLNADLKEGIGADGHK